MALYIQSEDSLIVHCPNDNIFRSYWNLEDQERVVYQNRPITFSTVGDVFISAGWPVEGCKREKYLYCTVERITHNAEVKVMLVTVSNPQIESDLEWPVEDRAVGDSIYSAIEEDYIKKNFEGAVTVPVDCDKMKIEIMSRR